MIRGLRSDLPASGIARDFVSPAGVHSLPNTLSTGLALRLGHARPDPIHPGLVSLPGSQSVLDPGRRFNRSGLTSAGEPRRRALPPDGHGGTFYQTITKPDQPGSEQLRDGAQRLPCVGSLHVREHGEGAWKNLSGLLSEKFGAKA